MIALCARIALPALVIMDAAGCASQPGDRNRILSFDEYARLEHPAPYILECADGRGRMLYYGARHCFDPHDPQMRDIERRWAAFKPSLALNEGGDPPIALSSEVAIRQYGEPGYLRWLAARDGVPVRTFEPSPQAEVNELLTHFTADQVRLFYCLRALAQDDARPEASRAPTKEGLLLGILEWVASRRGLEGGPTTVADFAACCGRWLPELADWRHPPMEWFDAAPRAGRPQTWLNRISRRASEFRDRFIVELLIAELRRGQRVFAVIGASHVVMQEPELRARLERVSPPTTIVRSTQGERRPHSGCGKPFPRVRGMRNPPECVRERDLARAVQDAHAQGGHVVPVGARSGSG